MSQTERKVILVPIDFTEVTRCAFDHALELCKLLKHEICLLHILEFTSTDQQLQKTQEALEKLSKEVNSESVIKIECIVKKGTIYTDIGAVAKEISAYLIIMGTHGTQGLQTVFGSRALKVITNSTVPFVVVQKKIQSAIKQGFKNIVLPLNLSKDSKQKLGWAIYIAKMFGSTINIITTHETEGFLLSKTKANLNLAKRLLLENGILYSTKVADKKGKNFADQTIEHAHHINANLIVVMTNEDKELREFLIGSFEEKLINNEYQIPVMCVNPRKDIDITQIIERAG
jgi:nucleotide-binding universal stress UspA family protein